MVKGKTVKKGKTRSKTKIRTIDKKLLNNQRLDDEIKQVIKSVEYESFSDIIDAEFQDFNYEQAERLIKKAKGKKVAFPTGEEAFLLEHEGEEYVVELSKDKEPYHSVKGKEEWFWDVEPSNYIPEEKDTFWQDVEEGEKVYHWTEEDRIDSIIENGLQTDIETRGTENKWMPAAVFTHPDPDAMKTYGDTLVSIDLGKMKKDGYTPDVIKEEPVEEHIIRNRLANYIDFEYYPDGDEYDNDTLAITGEIPSKYLTIEKDEEQIYPK